MARTPKDAISQEARIAMILAEEITGGIRAPGSRLPSLRALATRFGTSMCPVRQAVSVLAQQGLIQPRHGSGIYVRPPRVSLHPQDSAILCVPSMGHVFGELASALHHGLHDLGMFASTLIMSHGLVRALLDRALSSDARFLILQGGEYFPYQTVDREAFAGKHAIALLVWQRDVFLDRVHRILVDHAAASRAVAERLWADGHRRLLQAGPAEMIAHAAQWNGQGECPVPVNTQWAGFAGMWASLGGALVPFVTYHAPVQKLPRHDEARLIELLSGPQAATAVIGMRDVDAWDVREILRGIQPDALDRLTFIGNGDTPWSQTSLAPFTTLDWNLETIADLACGIIRDVQAGKTFATPIMRLIPPRLVVR